MTTFYEHFPAPRVLLNDARSAEPSLILYENPIAVIRADDPEQVEGSLAALEFHLAAGRYAAGYFSYELGYVLEPRLLPSLWPARQVPLLWFGIFDDRRVMAGKEAQQYLKCDSSAFAGPLMFEWDRSDYDARFDRVRELICAGDIYQANLTFRAKFAFAGEPMALYRTLSSAARAAHCAFVDDGCRQVLSISPELFFTLTRDRKLLTRPMKGTIGRDPNPVRDKAARAALAASHKDRAENLMIVDLLRNDLSRIASIGSVHVDELFRVETYPTTYHMVSTISANLAPNTTVWNIVRSLFPCGSVTGAPKIRAMEIIREVESSPRGIYCGSIGDFAPDGSASFNVAIRTLTVTGNEGQLGIGGGIVYDSKAQSEYDECLLKARYYTSARRPLELIETLRFSPAEGFIRLDYHMSRMASSSSTFGIPFDRTSAVAALEAAACAATSDLRLRLSLTERGVLTCRADKFDPKPPSLWRFAISERRMNSGDAMLRHKTSWRDIYDEEHRRAVTEEVVDEIVFQNEKGELTEGSRTTLFVCLGGHMVTPPLSAGVLDGCLRRSLLEKGHCTEMVIKPEDLARASAVYLGNSLRGLIPATLVSVESAVPA